ncbi:MAG TPA: Spy/CpxP family protein refolding chaperone [Usitatibacter sp.]|nr:Spy/CpxP family protein refolding chaperone [Usitatibacter sp.]
MKRKLIIAAAIAALFSAAAWAQWGPGYGGYGPGMMGGYGGGYGPGMMGGYGGYGMGPGMMGGYGGYGPGARGGYGSSPLDQLDLTDEQRDKIAAIEKDASDKRWDLMKAMHDLRWSSFGPDASKDVDPTKAYDAMAALRRQMFQLSVDTNKRIEAVLTKEQKEQLQKDRRGAW